MSKSKSKSTEYMSSCSKDCHQLVASHNNSFGSMAARDYRMSKQELVKDQLLHSLQALVELSRVVHVAAAQLKS